MKIEKGIPIPRSNIDRDFPILDKMEVGDSILFPETEWKRARNRAYIRKPKHFTFRRINGGYRCWRVV